jgi:hypothetical protein
MRVLPDRRVAGLERIRDPAPPLAVESPQRSRGEPLRQAGRLDDLRLERGGAGAAPQEHDREVVLAVGRQPRSRRWESTSPNSGWPSNSGLSSTSTSSTSASERVASAPRSTSSSAPSTSTLRQSGAIDSRAQTASSGVVLIVRRSTTSSSAAAWVKSDRKSGFGSNTLDATGQRQTLKVTSRSSPPSATGRKRLRYGSRAAVRLSRSHSPASGSKPSTSRIG